MGLLRSIN